MLFKENMSEKDKVSALQRYILVHSCLYYELDSSIIADKEYDKKAYLLVEIQKGINISDTDYGYVFKGFDGTTGFDLYSKLSEIDRDKIIRIANNVLKSYKDTIVVSTKK